MGRKKGAAVAIIAVVAIIGGIVAYSNMPRQDETNPPPVLTTIDRNDEPENDSTTIAEAPAEQSEQEANANGTVIANNTMIESDTLIINKPVYRNNTIIYQPVTINLEKYKTTINLHLEQEETDPEQPADTSHSITINAKRMKSEGWSARFTDDRVGMFTAVYDINGDLIRTGYADERGFTVRGLEDSLYFVFPADCTDCNEGKNDIMFVQWEDGSKDRPRLVPADSEVTASYRLVVPEKQKQVPLTPPSGETPPEDNPPTSPPPDETDTAAEPEITLRAQNATFVYGWVQVSVQLENMVEGFDEILISVYAPDGTLHDSFSYSDQQGFFASREAGEGNYWIVATYEYDSGTAEAGINHPIKFVTPVFVNLVAAEDNGAMRLNGLLTGGLAGENITIAIRSPDGEQLREYKMSFGTKPVFSLFIAAKDAATILNSTGNYTFTVTHNLTGVQGTTTFFNDAGETQTAATPINVSNNDGRSERARIAAEGNNIYLVWSDDTSAQNEILFAKSENAGETFSEPVAIAQPSEGGFLQTPDVGVSGDSVYVVWADYNSDEEAAPAFKFSSDAGETFGSARLLGNHTGEGTNPHVTLLGNDIYVSWIAGATEEFTGDLMLARSSGGIEFEVASVAQEADDATMTSSGDTLYLAWRHYPSGDTSDGRYMNMVARTDDGSAFETSEVLDGIAVTSLAVSGNDVYAAGFANETVVFARSSEGAEFNATEIANGTLAFVAASGSDVYLAWVQDGNILLATNSDVGETFGEAEEISGEDNAYWPRIALAESAYVVWTEDSDIMFASR